MENTHRYIVFCWQKSSTSFVETPSAFDYNSTFSSQIWALCGKGFFSWHSLIPNRRLDGSFKCFYNRIIIIARSNFFSGRRRGGSFIISFVMSRTSVFHPPGRDAESILQAESIQFLLETLSYWHYTWQEEGMEIGGTLCTDKRENICAGDDNLFSREEFRRKNRVSVHFTRVVVTHVMLHNPVIAT